MRILDDLTINSCKFIRINKVLYLFLILLLPFSLQASSKITLTPKSSIEDLHHIKLLRSKALASFKVANIRTIEDLMRFSTDQLLNLRGMANEAVVNIHKILLDQNLSLPPRKEALQNKQHILQIPIKCLYISDDKDARGKKWLNGFFKQFEGTDFTIQDIISSPITDYFKSDLNNRERVFLRDYLLDNFELSSEHLSFKDFRSQAPINESSKIEDLHLNQIVKYDPTHLLKEANIQSVGDLLNFSPDELKNIRGLSGKLIEGISKAFQKHEIPWKPKKKLLDKKYIFQLPIKDLYESRSHKGKAFLNRFFKKFDSSLTIEKFLDKPGKHFIKYKTTLEEAKYLREYLFEKFQIRHKNLSPENLVSLDSSITNLKIFQILPDFSRDPIKDLKRADILTIGGLLKFSQHQLLNIIGIRQNALGYIIRILQKHDLQLATKEESINDVSHILRLPINSLRIKLKFSGNEDTIIKHKLNKFFRDRERKVKIQDLISYPIEYYLDAGLTYIEIGYLKQFMLDKLQVNLDNVVIPINHRSPIQSLELINIIGIRESIRIEKTVKTVGDLLSFSELQLKSILGLHSYHIKKLIKVMGLYNFSFKSHEEALKDPTHILRLNVKKIRANVSVNKKIDKYLSQSLNNYIQDTDVFNVTVQDILLHPIEYYSETKRNNKLALLNKFLTQEAGVSFFNIKIILEKDSPIKNLHLINILKYEELVRVEKAAPTLESLLKFSKIQLRNILRLRQESIEKIVETLEHQGFNFMEHEDSVKDNEHILRLPINILIINDSSVHPDKKIRINQFFKKFSTSTKVQDLIQLPHEYYREAGLRNTEINEIQRFISHQLEINTDQSEHENVISDLSPIEDLNLKKLLEEEELRFITKANLKKVGDLLKFSKIQLRNILGLNIRTIIKIIQILKSYDLALSSKEIAERNIQHILQLPFKSLRIIVYTNKKIDDSKTYALNQFIQNFKDDSTLKLQDFISHPIDDYFNSRERNKSLFYLQDFLYKKFRITFLNSPFIKKKELISDPNVSISQLNLNFRVFQVLYEQNIRTLSDILKYSKQDLFRNIKGLSDVGIHNIISALNLKTVFKLREDEIEDLIKLHISNKTYAQKIITILSHAKISNIEELQKFSKKQLLMLKGLGEERVNDILGIPGVVLATQKSALKDKSHFLKIPIKFLGYNEKQSQNINEAQLLNKFFRSFDDLELTLEDVISHPMDDYFGSREQNNILFYVHRFLFKELGITFLKSSFIKRRKLISDLNASISQLDLGFRVFQALWEQNIRTLADLKRYSRQDLVNDVKGLGATGINSIVSELNLKTIFKLRMDTIEDLIRSNVSNKNSAQEIINIFNNAQINNMEDLQKFSKEQLLTLKGLGVEKLNDILNIPNITLSTMEESLKDVDHILKLPIKLLSYGKKLTANNRTAFLLNQFFRSFDDTNITVQEFISFPIEYYLNSISDYQIMFYVHQFFKDKYNLTFQMDHLLDNNHLIIDKNASMIYLNLSVRTYLILLNQNITIIDDLLKYSKKDLRSIDRIGPGIAAKIVAAIEEKTIFQFKND